MRTVCILVQQNRATGETADRADLLVELAEACYRFTPQIALRKGEAVFLEIEQCRRLYKEETLLLRLQALLKRFGLRARIGVADDPALALCLARVSAAADAGNFTAAAAKQRVIYELPLESLYDIANPFVHDEAAGKQVGFLIATLQKLGVTNLGGFLKLPAKSLTSRFRELGLELHRRVAGQSASVPLLWPSFIPPEKITEKINLDGFENCQTLEPLLFVIKSLVSRAMARLAGRAERATAFQLEFELEKTSVAPDTKRTWSFTLPLPQGSVNGVLPLIHERLQMELTRKPLVSFVQSIELRIEETVPGQYAQRNFFNRKEEEQEAWNSLMARLCQKLGRDHTFVASPVETYKPERSWKKEWLEKDAGELAGVELPFPKRPLRILRHALPLVKIRDSLVVMEGAAEDRKAPPYSPHDSRRWKVREWEGPERLSGEWWGEAFHRDYFRVGTDTGEQLWIYRIPDSDKVFLHGYFD